MLNSLDLFGLSATDPNKEWISLLTAMDCILPVVSQNHTMVEVRSPEANLSNPHVKAEPPRYHQRYQDINKSRTT